MSAAAPRRGRAPRWPGPAGGTRKEPVSDQPKVMLRRETRELAGTLAVGAVGRFLGFQLIPSPVRDLRMRGSLVALGRLIGQSVQWRPEC
jgi:hypothetical protein